MKNVSIESDYIEGVVSSINPLDEKAMQQARERQDSLTKPRGSLGRLEELSIQVAGIMGSMPSIESKAVFTLAGDHGVVEEGVSAYPQEVTGQMVMNFLNGGAAINVLASEAGARSIVVDMGIKADIDHPELVDMSLGAGTDNMAEGRAMSREKAVKAVESGIKIFEEEYNKDGIDLVAIGDMGIGNTTPSSALISCFTGSDVERVTDRGTGVDDEGYEKKVETIIRALEINDPNPDDPLDVLSKVGGFEIGGMAGVALAAASNNVPVVVDGFISGAAALLAYEIEPEIENYLIASHNSVESGHAVTLNHIGLVELVDFDMRLGEGTGAALTMPVIQSACRVLTDMMTFEEAKVSDRD
ncbi:nicotinate-nucleotide--dimethylbenzimidazole phosphoribosyltransferase [Methanonatronarchaeum sp. AMET-Sl]|uniref:nicotinate-nucleotide--dimethylbenzimidazole phosphoribosyltransferase n=1 Tax=Methanonatronarchaeum sp. AMET-Sl TaxID=3037654 RepID=UPI00244DAC76|nr:nicotinate-nucleotide--dimethylbenzimidazole phosphoribosyltransferase [Methanonatronarchaeum sp. AMET-Sl]WGI18140.1 nicotinate-nucleotide--dimethylbenzimidazole phosphoribosyltransferase [Methanonatronarchaeum sp. AMET-Sl]